MFELDLDRYGLKFRLIKVEKETTTDLMSQDLNHIEKKTIGL